MFTFVYNNANIPTSMHNQSRCSDIMQGVTGEMQRRMQRWFYTSATAGFLTLAAVFAGTVFSAGGDMEFPTDSAAPIVAISRWV